MWVVNRDSNDITELSPTGATLGTFKVGAGPSDTNLVAIAFDGASMWVANNGFTLSGPHGGGFDDVSRLSPTGATLGTFKNLDDSSLQPRALAFDGLHMWVVGYGGLQL
jgi:hypothetical protein